jgi:hypothetical protein
MKNKIRNLLFIVFLCIFVYPFIYYFIQSIEGFTDKSPYGQWELVLRQSYNDQYIKSPFKGNVSINIEALYDENGDINEPNYYNSSLYSKYDFSSNRILKLNYYDTYESKTPTTITWSQDISAVPTVYTDSTLDQKFKGLIQSTDASYVFVGYSEDSTEKYILGASQTYLDSRTDISYIPGYADTGVEKVELYLWNPRPNDKNTFNGNYKNLTISKVDMNDTLHKNFWNKSEDVSGLLDDTDNRYSYCFGKLRCNDNLYTPIENSKGNYKPYCNSDSSLNPVYCEGSALYNTNSTTFKPVAIGSLTFDMMGKYASYGVSNEEYFNLFRGLTTPYNSDYIDPEISGNDVVMYDTTKSTFVKNNICNFLDNTNLINGTNLQEECELTRYTGITDDDISFADTSGNKCIANYGDTINSKYKDYVCKENEACIGYECGVQFGKCSPSLL